MKTSDFTSSRLSTAAAKKVGEALSEIALSDGLTPEAVVAAARSPKSTLHKFFEWDDSRAAESYRLTQAAWLIRSVRVTIQSPDKKAQFAVRAFVRVTPDQDALRGIYIPVEDALQRDEWRAEMLADAKRELAAFRQKYAVLAELGDVFRAIDAIEVEPMATAAK